MEISYQVYLYFKRILQLSLSSAKVTKSMFLGFNSIMRGGGVSHHEYMQVGKGRDAGMNQLSNLEARVANGNGEQTLSRDMYRLGHRFDFYRMLSFFFTTVGFYFSSMVRILIHGIQKLYFSYLCS